MQRETSAFVFLGDRLTVSGPPTDGQPGGECLRDATACYASEDVNSQAPEKRTGACLDHSGTRRS